MTISKLKFGNLQLVESGNKFGPMSYSEKYYKAGLGEKERRSEFMANRMNLGAMYGFCGRHMFITNPSPTSGSYLEITKREVEQNFTGFPDAQVKSDILIITSDTPDVVIGGLHKEMPIILGYDFKERVLAAISCPPVIDREIPGMLIDAMTDYGLKEENIAAFISDSTEDVSYEDEPTLLGNDLERFVEVDGFGTYHVNPKDVFRTILMDRGIKIVGTSNVNTLYNYNYYYGDEPGFNYSGGFIMSENNCKRLGSKR